MALNTESSNTFSLMHFKVVVAGSLVLVAVTLVTYASALNMGFRFVDDYTFLHWAARCLYEPIPLMS